MWTVIQCAKEFGLSPAAAARELDTDPQQTMLEGLLFLRYAEVKAGCESKDEATRKAYAEHPLASVWSLNTFLPFHERNHPEPVAGCKMCHQKTTHPSPVDWCDECG